MGKGEGSDADRARPEGCRHQAVEVARVAARTMTKLVHTDKELGKAF